jgi:Tol biopolymer transport system component
VNLGPAVNSHSAASPSISGDQLELYFDTGTQIRPGGHGSGDIWVTRRESTAHPWGEPENLGAAVNGPFADGVPKLTRDGATLFFASNRPGGVGNRDIWVTTRRSRTEPWTPPRNLGNGVNGPANDWSPAISADERMLIFQSDRPGGLGGDDLWITTRESRSSPWSAPQHLGQLINTPYDDAKADFAPDDRTLLFMSIRPGGAGSLDIWTASIYRR